MSLREENLFLTKFLEKTVVAIIVYIILNNFSLTFNIDNLIKSAVVSIILTSIGSFVFEKWLWKRKIFRKLLNINNPIIEGRWEGYIKSSIDNFKTEYPIALEFIQNHKSVKLTYYDERAITHGIVSKLVYMHGVISLYCIYRNEPLISTRKLQIHYGTMILKIEPNQIKGKYFNNPPERKTWGELYVQFSSRQLKKSL